MTTPTLTLKYLQNYPANLIAQVQLLLNQNTLGQTLLKRYPTAHTINNNDELRNYILALKNLYLQKSAPLSKIIYDPKIHVINHALGLHNYVSRVQGGKLKSKNEIRISTLFKKAPESLLKMIAVHELAHLKEKEHDKAFYRLCQHMLPNYYQLEFDTRLYLTEVEVNGPLYQ